MVRRIRRVGALSIVLPVVLAALVGTAPTSGRKAGAAPAPALAPPRASILVDVDSGRVLAGLDHHTPQLPASTVKLLTALTALEHLSVDDTFTVSQLAADRIPLKMGMQPGESWRVVDALASLLIVSANDVAYALAEATSGSVEQFAVEMAATATRLGARDASTFADPAGLDLVGSVFAQPGRVSAFDLAVIARNAMAVPAIAGFAVMPEHRFTDLRGAARRAPGHNAFLRTYPGATGLKTGYTKAAGSTLVATATREGRTMLAVVLGADDTVGWASQLLDQGFATPRGAVGTGETVPEVRARTVDGGKALVETLPHALGRPELGVDPSSEAAVGAGRTSAAATTADAGGGAPEPAATAAGASPWAAVLAVPLVLLLAVAGLRVRVLVRRRRRRRSGPGRARVRRPDRAPVVVDVRDGPGVEGARVMARATLPSGVPVGALPTER